MPGRSYADFDLLIEKADDGYRARVQRSPGGEGSSDFQFPFSEPEIQKLLPRLAWPRRGRNLRRPGSARKKEIELFGEQLFRAVFSGEVETCLRRSLGVTVDRDQGLRLCLRFRDVPELARLPWEYLRDAQRSYLGMAEETPIVRYLELPRLVRTLRVEPPLRVLVVIANPEGTPPLDIDEEWSQIQQALTDLTTRGLLLLECFVSPTLEELYLRLRREPCHVLHFIGHGAFDRGLAEGFLLFADEEGRQRRVSGEELGTILSSRRISLAVLNACEGARHAEADAFAGVAQTLVQREIPAVVAMQTEITDRAAISFSGHFYQLLAEGFPVDGAVSEARKAMYAAGHTVEWGTPVLYMRSADGHLLASPGEPRHRRRWRGIVDPLRSPRVWLPIVLLVAVGYALTGPLKKEARSVALPSPVVHMEPRGGPPSPSSRPAPETPRPPSSSTRSRKADREKSPAWGKSAPECPSPPGTDLRFALIPKGSFLMGSNKKDEKPSHLVTITKPFCLGQSEVTWRQWSQVMGGKPNPPKQTGDELPVTKVSWDQAQQFVTKLNEVAGRPRFRLATEAEWEYAARASTITPYSFGDEPAELRQYGNCKGGQAMPVHQLQPNPWGLYDMHGNVWEWVEDWYGEYSAAPAVDPTGPVEGDKRVRRGGSFESSFDNCRSAARKSWDPGKGARDLGFRIVEVLN